jgi:hypothetical protein
MKKKAKIFLAQNASIRHCPEVTTSQHVTRQSGSPAVRQSGSPAVRQSGSPAVRQSGSPAVRQVIL